MHWRTAYISLAGINIRVPDLPSGTIPIHMALRQHTLLHEPCSNPQYSP